ncbi:MAG: hypothetical protein AAF790_10360 [Planctomycetota bacterium]
MPSLQKTCLALAAAAAMAVAGCGADSTAELAVPAQAAPPPSTDADAAEPSPASGPDAQTPGPAATASQAKPAARYQQPFPNRTELFAPIRRAPIAKRSDEESGGTVELTGFANVDRPKVILTIDGIPSPMQVDDERYGVRVISISPPSAVLQRGRTRWTATLP